MAAGQETNWTTLAGNLLVASPRVESRYRRQVVLLLWHTPQGAQGVLVNDQLMHSIGMLRECLLGDTSPARRGAQLRVQMSVPIVRWGPGELEAECERGVWMKTSADLDKLRGARLTRNLWFDLVRHIGRSVLSESLRIKELPRNPALN